MDPILFVLLFIVAAVVIVFLMGIRIVRPTNRGLIERLGRYRRFAKGGFNWIIPLVDRMIQVSITEQMVDAQSQENGLKIHPSPESVVWGVGRMFSDLDRARWMGGNGRRAVQEHFTWDTITKRMLTIYLGLCPSPATLPHRAADGVPKVLAGSSRKTTWSGVTEEDSPAIIEEERSRGPHNPRRQDHTLTMKGDWETVLVALNRCRRHMQRIRVHHDQQPGIKTTAIFGQASTDNLVFAAS